MFSKMNRLLSHPKIQSGFNAVIHNRKTVSITVKALQKFGKLETNVQLKEKLLNLPDTTVAVLNAQLNEILNTRFDLGSEKHQTLCYFAMSAYDPLLQFDTALETVNDHFQNVKAVRLTHSYHQPPKPLTYEELNQDYYQTVDAFMHVQTEKQALTFQGVPA